MACGVCEHCQSPFLMRDEIAIRDGFSYHKKCHKCYVCSETNLHNAELFKGVIFCSSCAQRIFQGCASVRKTKQQATNRTKHSRSRSRTKREKIKTQEKRMDRDIKGVIELAQLAGSTSGSCGTVPSKKYIVKSSKQTTTTMPIQVEQLGYDFQLKKSLKAVSLEMGTTTEVTQNLLKQINEPEIRSLKREKIKTQEKRMDRDIKGVIELAQLAGSTSGSWETVPSKKFNVKSSKQTTTTMPIQVEQLGYDFQRKKSLKAVSLEMGTTTVETQKLLKQINAAEVRSFNQPISPKVISSVRISNPQTYIPPVRHRKKKKDIVPPRTNKLIVSDLRIAELGVSTEIANMALRKKSELPIIIRSDSITKQVSSENPSVLNQESAESRDGQAWMNSTYTYRDDHKRTCLDRRLGSIIKLPYTFFKKNILARSSLISIAMSSSDNRLLKRVKNLFHEEMTDHQGRGMTRLYSTINRRKRPYRLGWLNLVAKVSKALYEVNSSLKETPNKPSRNMSIKKHSKKPPKLCKHFKASHSYRCMRAQAMRLAGPTPSQLAVIRKKIKKFIVPRCVMQMARGVRNIQESKKEEQPKKCDLETVFKATSTRKPAGNTWGNISKAYNHLWTAAAVV